MPRKIFDRTDKKRQRVDAETLAVLKGEGRQASYSYDRRVAGFLQYRVNGQAVTNLEPEEATKLRGLVRSAVSGGKASVRLWTRGSTKGWTDINVYEGSQDDYRAVLALIKRLGYVTDVAYQEHMRRIEKYNWDFPPGGITVFKPV